jgi:hypothetical protein
LSCFLFSSPFFTNFSPFFFSPCCLIACLSAAQQNLCALSYTWSCPCTVDTNLVVLSYTYRSVNTEPTEETEIIQSWDKSALFFLSTIPTCSPWMSKPFICRK